MNAEQFIRENKVFINGNLWELNQVGVRQFVQLLK